MANTCTYIEPYFFFSFVYTCIYFVICCDKWDKKKKCILVYKVTLGVNLIAYWE